MIKARARHNLKYVDYEKIKNNPTVYAVTFTCNMYKLIKICPQQFSSHLWYQLLVWYYLQLIVIKVGNATLVPCSVALMLYSHRMYKVYTGCNVIAPEKFEKIGAITLFGAITLHPVYLKTITFINFRYIIPW